MREWALVIGGFLVAGFLLGFIVTFGAGIAMLLLQVLP